MNRRQARRLASWVNGMYLVGADHTGFSDEENAAMGEDAQRMVADATRSLGLELVARSGIPIDATFPEAMALAKGGAKGRDRRKDPTADAPTGRHDDGITKRE